MYYYEQVHDQFLHLAGSKFLGMWTSGSNSVAAIRMHYPGGVAMFFSDTKKSLPLSVVMKGRNEEEKCEYMFVF